MKWQQVERKRQFTDGFGRKFHRILWLNGYCRGWRKMSQKWLKDFELQWGKLSECIRLVSLPDFQWNKLGMQKQECLMVQQRGKNAKGPQNVRLSERCKEEWIRMMEKPRVLSSQEPNKGQREQPLSWGLPLHPQQGPLFPPPKVVQVELGVQAGAGRLPEDASPPLKQKESWGPEPHLLTPGFIRLRPLNLPLLLSRFSRVWLCATPWTSAYQTPPSLGFSRQEYWSRVPAVDLERK